MKKLVYFAALLLTVAFTSCEKEDIGGTATESMAGQWYVTVDAVGDDGNAISGGEDYLGYGRQIVLTYNTSSNLTDSMWISSNGAYNLPTYYDNSSYPNYCFTAKVAIDIQNQTFKATESKNINGDYPVTITDGKILYKAGKQNNGSPADSIVFFISFKGDPWYPGDGYAKYKVSGVRYSGLEEND